MRGPAVHGYDVKDSAYLRTGIAQSEGRGKVQRNMLCLVGALSL